MRKTTPLQRALTPTTKRWVLLVCGGCVVATVDWIFPHTHTQAIEEEKAVVSRRERDRLRMQDKVKRDNLEKLRAQQNREASRGEVRVAATGLSYVWWWGWLLVLCRRTGAHEIYVCRFSG